MEATWRWTAVAAIGPVSWGATYFVTRHELPAGYPLHGAVLRALPAGLLLLCLRPVLPRGAWWWRSLVLGALNMGVFYVLVYVAGQVLPTSVAAVLMANSPLVMAAFAWLLLGERPRAAVVAGAAVGIAGVVLAVGPGARGIEPAGVAASAGALLLSSLGYVLTKRWGRGEDVVATTAWQLVAGGLTVLPFAVALEPVPPLGPRVLAAFAVVSVVATAFAFVAWFAALDHLPAASVALVGLLNPVTGVLLGTALGGERLGARQVLGVVLVVAGIGAAQVRRRVRGRPSRREGDAPRADAAILRCHGAAVR